MKDSDDIRRVIEARLLELRLEAVQVSQELGFNRGYLHDYLRKGTPRKMPNDVKMRLASRLGMEPHKLGVPALVPTADFSGMGEDCEPYEPGPNDLRPPPHIALFRVRSRSLDAHPRNIKPGRLVGVNLNQVDPAQIANGAVVVAQLYDRVELTRSHGTVFRQFLAPDKLVTNSTGGNSIISLDDPMKPFVAVIKGVLAYVVDDLHSDSLPPAHEPPHGVRHRMPS